jgi:hypothetical protein
MLYDLMALHITIIHFMVTLHKDVLGGEAVNNSSSAFKKSSKDVYAWCCDYEDYRGEGRLARFFVEYVIKKNNNKFYIKTPNYFFESSLM